MTFDKDPLVSQEEAAKIVAMKMDPDAFYPEYIEDQISKMHDYASWDVFVAYSQGLLVERTESPYILRTRSMEIHNPEFPEGAICNCGHKYYRHFDTHDDMLPVGCKYCLCVKWVAP